MNSPTTATTPTTTPRPVAGDTAATNDGLLGIKPQPQSQQPQQRPHHPTSGHGLVDVRFAVIGPNDGPMELSRLCLVMVLDTSDVCVYYLHEATNTTTSITTATTTTTTTKDTVASANSDYHTTHNHNHNHSHNHNQTYFLKLEHSVVTRKRRSRRDRRKALEGTLTPRCTL